MAKRYYRAALLALVAYFEGVLNRWLKQLLAEPDWVRAEGSCIKDKIKRIHGSLPSAAPGKPSIEDAKKLRDLLMHFKPGRDGDLYDGITGDLLARTEAEIDGWLTAIERRLGFKRHLDSREESRSFREALGPETPGSEGYSGDT